MLESLRNLPIRAAIGDLLAAFLALAAIPTVLRNINAARLLVWVFNVEGTVDLLVAITLATIYGASVHMGPAYWIPAFWVLALLVTHYIAFAVVRKHWTGATRERASEDLILVRDDRWWLVALRLNRLPRLAIRGARLRSDRLRCHAYGRRSYRARGSIESESINPRG